MGRKLQYDYSGGRGCAVADSGLSTGRMEQLARSILQTNNANPLASNPIPPPLPNAFILFVGGQPRRSHLPTNLHIMN